MLALNGLFVLVTRHGLEYPEFYKALYGLLQVRGQLSRGEYVVLNGLELLWQRQVVVPNLRVVLVTRWPACGTCD